VRVCIGCQGRFHLFDLARQMERLGHLGHLYTGYPRFKVQDLPASKVSTFPWLMGPYMALGRIGFGQGPLKLEYHLHSTFDRWMARNLEPCDVYHCLSGIGLLSRQTAKRYGAITICDRASTHILYQHGLLRDEFDRWGIPYPRHDQRLIERELEDYDLSDVITLPSEVTVRSFIENKVPPHKLRKNPFGVSLTLFSPQPKPDDVFRLLFVGQISLRKGIPYLLESLAPLHSARFELCLAGAILPEARSFLRRYEGGFNYLGVVPHVELRHVYSRCSVFVIPSLEEGLAYVQAEAMACGLPVIATPNTGAEELFTNGIEGFIVPIRDPEAIREKVLLLYRNPELREEMSRAALRRVQAIGGWNDYGERAAAIYKEQLNSKASKAPLCGFF
jgi:alpha-maltose-1-phosphate synthase